MQIQFRLINGHIVRASFENKPELAGFGDTEGQAIAALLKKEKARNLELQALYFLLRSLLGSHQDGFLVN
ncbi:hypothetical protein A3C09_03825 [Candidatus Uhrbacteria bacterium RIFCSPHIGHO2_02_FULL_47_44]|uniref:Uncharacterized protein n=1 Tax=Candidatus Uhrbacteria bacterium RIFCSPLOWO2_02_FULL_48_18 TaxID=1802408 RepID=A0A1F7VDJ0_9BACT|nr:MAG: hypothetical protein A2839_00695 [Candidatus Uhrbacteria bacterium RIFCSPHIGHO2_01_FULL_47_10]OGL71807.1 MAG: hypothetical protein A3C09_03825 [Candidatus Uhrbacteria bacterium RIFCSPHIGHO2_02_FULL_47_44]OGL80619.1 MAG: hypothetical protein A3B20_04460 [Candidatus Uhrbacteria bacterium RIFCSPLOWO2_01_FULL_47_17]OGL88198.1 MAG: hypothetical protein A3I41_00520 [Candidatus Uhrbacteria bacterium RIFCSPLOWO2_02_FULL_48_18]OGL92345.1 MAG: hypothetical protein A3H12_03255 [Candidatus Uhrbacte